MEGSVTLPPKLSGTADDLALRRTMLCASSSGHVHLLLNFFTQINPGVYKALYKWIWILKI